MRHRRFCVVLAALAAATAVAATGKSHQVAARGFSRKHACLSTRLEGQHALSRQHASSFHLQASALTPTPTPAA